MSALLKDWLHVPAVRKAACLDGYQRSYEMATALGDDEACYNTYRSDADFLFGVAYRQPAVAFQALSAITLKHLDMAGVASEVKDALVAAVDPGIVNGELLGHFQVVSCLKHGDPLRNKYVDQIAYRLLWWRMGRGRPTKTTDGIRGLIVSHRRQLGQGLDLLEEARKQVPFDLWHQGLQL